MESALGEGYERLFGGAGVFVGDRPPEIGCALEYNPKLVDDGQNAALAERVSVN